MCSIPSGREQIWSWRKWRPPPPDDGDADDGDDGEEQRPPTAAELTSIRRCVRVLVSDMLRNPDYQREKTDREREARRLAEDTLLRQAEMRAEALQPAACKLAKTIDNEAIVLLHVHLKKLLPA